MRSAAEADASVSPTTMVAVSSLRSRAISVTSASPFALAAAMGASAVGDASGMRRRAWPAKIRSRINQQIAERGNAMLAWLRDLTSRECRTMLAC